MLATMQIRVDDERESAADTLYAYRGFDTPARRLNAETLEAMEDVRHRRNLYGPYNTVREAMEALEDVRLRRNLHGPYKNAAAMIEDCLRDDDEV